MSLGTRLSAAWLRPQLAIQRAVRSDHQLAERVRELAKEFAVRRDAQLAAMLSVIRREVGVGGMVLEPKILEPAFALVYEAVRRTTGMQLYPVQILAGAALARGGIAEMKTGEGKTVVVALPAVLHALRSRGVHVATVNSYLAQRDFELLEPGFSLLGLTSGLLHEGDAVPRKQVAYACDITYGTGYEFGFDYLRDQVQLQQNPRIGLGHAFRARLQGRPPIDLFRLQRRHGFAIIDEADSVLLDEANTPLVISQGLGQGGNSHQMLQLARQVAAHLQPGLHFVVRPRERTITILSAGQTAIFSAPQGVPTRGLVRPWMTYVENALRAQHVLRRDVDFVVQDQAVMLVDPHTGRIFSDRSWQNGLHQAVECEAGVPITRERNTSARISRQRYFRFYEQVCGMTGTATGQEREFREFYNLPVVVIPVRLPCRRTELPTLYFPTQLDKFQAIVSDVRERHQRGQPLLIGTRTIEESEHLARLLDAAGLRHQLLNGKQDANEAELIADAGKSGAITVATNMAGRGTDISIDANAELVGGLHVIVTQRQESRRVDRQLIGRSARQGQVGSSQVFVSAEDELLVRFGPRIADRLRALTNPAGTTSPQIDRAVALTQRRAEEKRYLERRDMWHHDQWMTKVLVAVADRDSRSTPPSTAKTTIGVRR